MLYSENASQKMMITNDRSQGSSKFSLKNKVKKLQKAQPNSHNQNYNQKILSYTSVYKPYQHGKNKIQNQTDNFVSTIEDQSMFNCLQNSKTVLKFNQNTQISFSEKQFKKHYKQNSEFSGYSSKLNPIKYNDKPISQNNFGTLSSHYLKKFKALDSCTIINTQQDFFLNTEANEKYSLKKKDNFQLKIKPHCYPCFKYSDIMMPIKKITKQQLRQIQDFKHLVYKNTKQKGLSRMLCNTYNKSTVDEGCQCFPKCLWVNRWMLLTNHQEYTNNSLFSSRSQNNYSQIVKQIQKDILRTQISNKFFSNSQNKQKLREVLQNYARVDSNVGYVQGMNIIGSIVIYHSICSITANELFKHLMQTAGLRKIYLNDLSFGQNLNKELMKELKYISFDLYTHLTNQSIDINAFTCSWYFSLMGIFIPLQFMHLVLDKFFRKSWRGINEIIISILLYKKQKLMSRYEQQLFQCFSIKQLQQQSIKIDWRELFVRSQNILLPKITI